MCQVIIAVTGIQATTSVVGLNKLIKSLRITDLALLTPYTDDLQAAIVMNYGGLGVNCSIESILENMTMLVSAITAKKCLMPDSGTL